MDVNFACKSIPIDQILRCSFGLSLAEFSTLKTVMRRKESTVEELAEQLGKDRTTVQRALKPLLGKGLIRRRQYNLDGGGYQYSYAAVDKESIKQQIAQHFVRFSDMVKKEVERW